MGYAVTLIRQIEYILKCETHLRLVSIIICILLAPFLNAYLKNNSFCQLSVRIKLHGALGVSFLQVNIFVTNATAHYSEKNYFPPQN